MTNPSSFQDIPQTNNTDFLDTGESSTTFPLPPNFANGTTSNWEGFPKKFAIGGLEDVFTSILEIIKYLQEHEEDKNLLVSTLKGLGKVEIETLLKLLEAAPKDKKDGIKSNSSAHYLKKVN